MTITKRPHRLNVRLSDEEYDSLYSFGAANRCQSLDAAMRLLIEKYTTTSSGGAKKVPITRHGNVIQ